MKPMFPHSLTVSPLNKSSDVLKKALNCHPGENLSGSLGEGEGQVGGGDE